MTTDPIKALVNLGPELETEYGRLISLNNYKRNASISRDALAKIITAIEALKPVVDGTHVVVGSVFLNDLRAIADTGGRRIETAMDACDKIIELIDMERQLGPAAPAPSRFEIDGTSQDFYDCEGSDAPAPSDEGVVKRTAEALKRLNYVVDNFWNDDKRTENFEAHAYAITRAQGMARAALAAIKGVE